MRIALLSESCDQETGIGRIVFSLAKEFTRLGEEVHVVAQRIRGIDADVRRHPVPRVPSSGALSKLVLRFTSPGIIRRNRWDIVHTFGVGRRGSIVSAQSCHKAGMRILKHHKHSRIWRKSLGVYDRISLGDEHALFSAATTKRIIAVSKLVKEQIITLYGVASEKVVIIPNGITYELFAGIKSSPAQDTHRDRLGLSRSDLVLLFVGNEFDRKGLQTIIEALPMLDRRDICLLVVGGDDPAPYERLASELGVGDKVRFLGQRMPEQYYKLADALVLPSLYEPFGIVILEAMAAGVPVIATSSCGAVEGMKNEVHGLYLDDPLSSKELSQAIAKLAGSESLRRDLAIRAQQRAAEFSWKGIAGRMLALYEQTLAGNT